MVYALLPVMVLLVYSSVKAIDPLLPAAAATLGAGRLAVFWWILVPLSRPGLAAGGLLVFVLGLGFFITPALLGGVADATIGVVIEAQMNRLLDWGFGSALAVALMLVVGVLSAAALTHVAPAGWRRRDT
jgi:ABC-type spermidine/putrescine transport system permease subunit I